MQEYICLVKGEAVEFKLSKANKREVQKYQKAFANDFEGSYDEMFQSIASGGLLDGIYTNPLESLIEVYKGSSGVGEPLFTINIKEISDAVNGEVIDEAFIGISERSVGTIGDFRITLRDDEVFDPSKLVPHISTIISSNGAINIISGFSYKGFEGIPEQLGLEFVKGVDADLLLDGYSMELDIKDQNFVFNFGDNNPPLLSQEQLDTAAKAYLKQYKEYEKPLLEAFRNNLTVEVVKKAAAYFSIARTLPGTSVKRYRHVIEALNLIHPVNVNHFEKIHNHLKKSFGVANLPSATSKFVFLKFKSHTFPIYDSVVKRSLGLKANCAYEDFQAAFYKVFLNYQKELKIACNKLDDDIAKQAFFQMRVLDLALWELQK